MIFFSASPRFRAVQYLHTKLQQEALSVFKESYGCDNHGFEMSQTQFYYIGDQFCAVATAV